MRDCEIILPQNVIELFTIWNTSLQTRTYERSTAKTMQYSAFNTARQHDG